MGFGGTGDGAVGRAAVKALPLLILILLTACSSTPEIVAVLSGGVAGSATGNPAVGFAVGVAVDAGATYAIRYYGRSRQGAEQDAIAQVAGQLPIGTEAAWKIEHAIPISDEHGKLRVIRRIDSPLTVCKEIAFSVDEGRGAKLQRSWFTSDICKQAATWKWASAEPAVARWGFLQ